MIETLLPGFKKSRSFFAALQATTGMISFKCDFSWIILSFRARYKHAVDTSWNYQVKGTYIVVVMLHAHTLVESVHVDHRFTH
jgi:hypothetical protein